MSEVNEQNDKRPKGEETDITRSYDGLVLGPGGQIGHFRIEREIGRGSMGVVYLACDTTLGRSVAIKSLPPEVLAGRKIRLRLEREARLLASLNHPNIATIYEELEEAEGAIYLILEYVHGQILADRISTGPLRLDETLSIACQTAAALAAAHERGIIHRDLKPGNIKITPEGNVKVLDFGLAKAIEEAEIQSTVTQPGRIIGTPAYMSPEQAVGDPVDYRTDIWSLGVVIYEMLTGELPFQGDTRQALTHCILQKEPERLTHVRRDAPPGLERIVRKMLQKDRFSRPENIKAVLEGLEDMRCDSVIDANSLESPPSIAILPFVDMSPGMDQEYFCDGMAEELINALTQIKGLHVIARTSAFSYKGRDVNIRDVGRELDVASILEGSVRKAGNRLRITAQLVDTTGGHHIWSERYDREMDDIFVIQDEITSAIVEKLKPRFTGDAKAQIIRRQTVDLDVYDLYLKGLYFRVKSTKEAAHRAIECFEQAIKLNPKFALAYAGLAVAYGLVPFYCNLPSKQVIPKATQMALKALQIDGRLSEAYAALGFIKTYYDWDWVGAESKFKQAIKLNPGYANAHHWYSHYLLFTARFDESLREMDRALELDPISVLRNRDLGTVYYYAGQFYHAIEAWNRAVEMDPSIMYVHFLLGAAYWAKSMYEEALREFQKEREFSKGSNVWSEWGIGATYAIMGRRDEAQEVLDNLIKRSKREYVSPAVSACLHFVLEKYDEGFKLLNKAYVQHDLWLCYLKISPSFDIVRSDPRYTSLLKKMNMDD